MKKLFFILLLPLLAIYSEASNVRLSDRAFVSLLSCEPSEEIYARFWHTAIRVCDPEQDIDIAYNYGIFDFSEKGFIPKFVSGATDYMLASYEAQYFLESYIDRQSTVYEQVLDLSSDQRQRIFDLLEENAKPENRIYRYNFVYDNCATRAYYMIKKVIDEASETMVVSTDFRPTTYRMIFAEFLGSDNWQRFAIDFVIAREADLPLLEPEPLVAFPKYTKDMLSATVLVKDSIERPLVSQSRVLSKYPTKIPNDSSWFRPTIVCSLLLILFTWFTVWGWKKQRYFIWVDVVLFSVLGLMGMVIFYLAVFSSHPLVHQNFNLLWANPLHIVFALAILKKSWRKWLSLLAIASVFAAFVSMIIMMTRFQVMNAAFLALIALSILRSVMFFQYHFKQK